MRQQLYADRRQKEVSHNSPDSQGKASWFNSKMQLQGLHIYPPAYTMQSLNTWTFNNNVINPLTANIRGTTIHFL